MGWRTKVNVWLWSLFLNHFEDFFPEPKNKRWELTFNNIGDKEQNKPPEGNITCGYCYPSCVTFGLSSLSLSARACDMRCATKGYSAVIGLVEVKGSRSVLHNVFSAVFRGPTLAHTIHMRSRQAYWMTLSRLFERMLHNLVAFRLSATARDV